MWPFEARCLYPSTGWPGKIPPGWVTPVMGVVVVIFWGLLYLAALPIDMAWVVLALAAMLWARQMALDLGHQVLLNVYTYPLLLLAFLYHGLSGTAWAIPVTGAVLGWGGATALAWGIARLRPGHSGLGGGDVKLLAALGAWVGPGLLLSVIGLGCLLSLLLSLRQPKADLPLGPGLIVAGWVLTLWPQAPQALFLFVQAAISG